MGKRAIGSPIFNWQFGCETNETSFGTGIGPGQYNGAIYEVGQPSNMWQHLTGTYSNGTWTLYQNGLQVAFNNLAPSADSEAALTFGNSGGFESFHGSLDDIAIYNRALTAQEIQNLYTGTTPAPCAALPSNLQQGLVGYWPFCGNANDESGNGNNGTVNGATLTEDRFGKQQSAYSFNGISDYIEIVDDSTLDLTNQYSLAAWINIPDYSLNIQSEPMRTVLSKPRPGGGGGYSLRALEGISFNGGNALAYVSGWNNELTNGGLASLDTIPLYNWTYIAFTYDGETAKLYKNGQLNNQLTTAFMLLNSDISLFFGKEFVSNNSGSRWFKGSLDDIGIWNRALTAEEVQELYTLDACTFTVYDTSYVTIYDTLTTYETVYDTLYTYETIYDTVTTYVTVTDTLLIDITFTGFEGQPSWLNTVTVFPNPASDHITIDYGNFALMAGYNTVITDAAGATVYSSAVNSQQAYIDINAWGAAGVYYMTIYDASGTAVAVRHIVLE
jgi:hypothetical protein